MKVKRRKPTGRFAMLAVRPKPVAGCCNFPLADGTSYCRLPAGQKTKHPGSGYCDRHDAVIAYDPIHRYRPLKQHTIRRRLRQLIKTERNVFDLVPEIQLLRSLLIDYIERYYTFREELSEWCADKGKKKPMHALDLSDAAKLVESVGRMIERHHRIESTGSIDLETFRRATEAMGLTVARHVRDRAILEAIEAEWADISLDAKSPLLGPPAVTVEAKPIREGDLVDAEN